MSKPTPVLATFFKTLGLCILKGYVKIINLFLDLRFCHAILKAPKQTEYIALLPHFCGFTYPFGGSSVFMLIAVQQFLNDPDGKINIGNFPVLVQFITAVCGVITV